MLPVWVHIEKSMKERSVVRPTLLGIVDGGVAPHKDVGCVDPSRSKSFFGPSAYNQRNDPRSDHIPHGTGLAGVVCSSGREDNTSGVLPFPAVVSVVSLKMADGTWNGMSMNSTQAELCLDCVVPAFKYFAGLLEPGEIGITSNSYGSTGSMPTEIHESIKSLKDKVLFVFAVGNNSANNIHDPARDPNVIAVAALDKYGWVSPDETKSGEAIAWFSNWSSQAENVVFAYGSNYRVAYPGDYYAFAQGTSQATPTVAALAAYLTWETRQQGVTPTTTMIRKAVFDGAKRIFVYTGRSFSPEEFFDPANFAWVKKADWEGSRLALQKAIDAIKKEKPVSPPGDTGVTPPSPPPAPPSLSPPSKTRSEYTPPAGMTAESAIERGGRGN
ncbi:MAG: S8/S53 family peptidase [Candidatus Paceibacterota bacterium]